MVSKIFLISQNKGEINNFINKYYSTNNELYNSLSWEKKFENPIDMAEFIGVYADNINLYNITMWISLDENIFIRISNNNANSIIKYLFERYPY